MALHAKGLRAVVRTLAQKSRSAANRLAGRTLRRGRHAVAYITCITARGFQSKTVLRWKIPTAQRQHIQIPEEAFDAQHEPCIE
jgi:hypothetical protein